MNKSQAVGKATNRSAARSRLPTAMGAVLKMSGSSMSDEFDSLDATEKAAVEAAPNNAKRPSDDVVQTASVKCRYTKSAFAQTSQAFAFAGRRISICRAAMTPEQEKTALDRLAGQLAHGRALSG